MVVRFEITEASGRVVVGPVQGSGGQVGNGCLHLGLARAEKEALRDLRRMIDRANAGEEHGRYEPSPGCVVVFPHYNAEGNGEEVVVSLVGASARTVRLS